MTVGGACRNDKKKEAGMTMGGMCGNDTTDPVIPERFNRESRRGQKGVRNVAECYTRGRIPLRACGNDSGGSVRE